MFLAEHIVMTGLSDDIVMTRKPLTNKELCRVRITTLTTLSFPTRLSGEESAFVRVGRTFLSASF